MQVCKWLTRSANVHDFEQISKYGGSGRRSSSKEYFIWKLTNNPVQEGFAYVADCKGQVVGTTTITPKKLSIRGALVHGAEIGDTFTHVDFQHRGIFTSLVNVSREEAIAKDLKFIYGTPNNNSLPGYQKKCNFKIIDSLMIQMLICPINFHKILAAKLPSNLIARCLSPVFQLLFKFIYTKHKKTISSNGFSVNKLEGDFPLAINKLAQKSMMQYDWLLYRDKKYLDWRFIHNPDLYHIWIAHQDETLLGYIVCKNGLWNNLTVGYLADFSIDMDYTVVYQSLVKQAMLFFIEQKVDMIATWAVQDTPYSKILKHQGFLKAWNLPLIGYNNEIGSSVSSTVTNGHFTMADSDNI